MVCSLVTSQCIDSTVTIATLNRMGKILTVIAKYFLEYSSQTSLNSSKHCLVLCCPLFHGTVTYWEQDICYWTAHQGSANLPKACQAQLPKPPLKYNNHDIRDSRTGSEWGRCVGVEMSPSTKLHSSVPGCAAEIQVVLTCSSRGSGKD